MNLPSLDIRDFTQGHTDPDAEQPLAYTQMTAHDTTENFEMPHAPEGVTHRLRSLRSVPSSVPPTSAPS